MKKIAYMLSYAVIAGAQISNDVAASSFFASLKQKAASIKKKIPGAQLSAEPAPASEVSTPEQSAADEAGTTSATAAAPKAAKKKSGISSFLTKAKSLAGQVTSKAQAASGLVAKASQGVKAVTQGVKTATQIANEAVSQVGAISKAVTGKDLAIVQRLQSKVSALSAGAEKVANKVQDVSEKVQDVSEKVGSTIGAIGAIAGLQSGQPEAEEEAAEVEQTEAQTEADTMPAGKAMTAEGQQPAGTQTEAQTAELVISQETRNKVDPIFAAPGTYIRAGRHNITDADMPYFVAKLIERYQEVGRNLAVDLSDNLITVVGFRLLLGAIKEHVKLVGMLSLSGNSLGDEGAQTLNEHIPSMVTTTTICLQNTKMSEGSIHSIVETIAQSNDSVITHLDLSGNPITQAGLERICATARTLKGSSLSQGLYLKGNQVTVANLNAPEIVRV